MATLMSKWVPIAALLLSVATVIYSAGARGEVLDATRSANAATMQRLADHERMSGHPADHVAQEGLAKSIADLADAQREMQRTLGEAREDLARVCVRVKCR